MSNWNLSYNNLYMHKKQYIYENTLNPKSTQFIFPYIKCSRIFHFLTKCFPYQNFKIIDINAFDRFPEFFFPEKPNDNHSYVRIFGKSSGKRVYRWLRKDYLAETENLDKYKVLVPKANGSGTFGEVLSSPLVCEKGTGFTETFIAIGAVNTYDEAESI